jgi:hypothetical protein
MAVPTPQYAYQPSMDMTLDAALTVATAKGLHNWAIHYRDGALIRRSWRSNGLYLRSASLPSAWCGRQRPVVTGPPESKSDSLERFFPSRIGQ